MMTLTRAKTNIREVVVDKIAGQYASGVVVGVHWLELCAQDGHVLELVHVRVEDGVRDHDERVGRATKVGHLDRVGRGVAATQTRHRVDDKHGRDEHARAQWHFQARVVRDWDEHGLGTRAQVQLVGVVGFS